MSRHLAGRSVDHVVLERGEVANSWRTERWDSLRLLTPNWMTRLPGCAYQGDDPDGYMTVRRSPTSSRGYAAASPRRCVTGTTVTSRAGPAATGSRWTTDQRRAGSAARRGRWPAARTTRGTSLPSPGALPDGVASITGDWTYRNPDQLRRRRRAGRRRVGERACRSPTSSSARAAVTLAVGEHVRVPRTYRGRDILWWLDAARHPRRAVGRGRRPRPGPAPAVVAARRRVAHPRPQRPPGLRRPPRRPVRRGPGRTSRSSRAPWPTSAPWPT